MTKRSPFEDHEVAAFAWKRYRRILRHIALFAAAVVLVAFALIWWEGSSVSYHFYIALALGVGLTIMLTGALMGLIFLSNGTNHDEAVEQTKFGKRPTSRWRD